MPAQVTTDQIWNEINKRMFAVLGMVNAKGHPRTAGVVYVAKDGELYIGTSKGAWKTRYVQHNPNVSITVTIAKRIPFIAIPPATITFQGKATIQSVKELDPAVLETLYHGMDVDDAFVADTCVIRVSPHGDFISYGVGVSVLTMRNPEKSQGRASVQARQIRSRIGG